MGQRDSTFPDRSRLSILIATILLAYTLTHFVTIPALEVDFSILGIFFPVRINFTTLVTLLVAGLMASGTAWLLHDHPQITEGTTTLVHWLLPTLTALVLLQSINQLPLSGAWWIAALASGFLLLLVLLAEFAALDSGNRFYIAAEMVITALSIVLFLILAISLHSSETRLFSRVPVLSFSALLVFLRVIHLRQQGNWAVIQGAVSFLLIGELTAVLHYWPLDSIGFGISLTGPLYALIEISDLLPTAGERLAFKELLWPALIIFLSWGIALII